jgi:hypothetical protein
MSKSELRGRNCCQRQVKFEEFQLLLAMVGDQYSQRGLDPTHRSDLLSETYGSQWHEKKLARDDIWVLPRYVLADPGYIFRAGPIVVTRVEH